MTFDIQEVKQDPKWIELSTEAICLSKRLNDVMNQLKAMLPEGKVPYISLAETLEVSSDWRLFEDETEETLLGLD